MKRRQFLSQSACAALSGSALLNMLFHLRTVGSAIAASGAPIPDYKGLVCVFLKGGNDTNNVLIPTAAGDFAAYQAARGTLALGTAPASLNTAAYTTRTGDPRTFGFHPNLAGLKSLYDAGDLALIANAGSLVQPTTKATYGTVSLPPQLFSHSDQQVQWQSSVPDQVFSTGWGGRMADLMAAANTGLGAQISISITLAGANSFQVGVATSQYAVSTAGSVPFSGYGTSYANALNADGTYKATNQGERLKAFHSIMNLGRTNLFQGAHAGVINRAYDADRLLTAALSGITLSTTFPTTTLGSQLAMIAKLIRARENLSQRRQIFFCALDGFDTHDSQTTAHGPLLTELNDAIAAFQAEMNAASVAEKVTLFTASDFARTYTANKSDTTAGSDHAWGGHALVAGGAVNGANIYGRVADLTIGGNDDVPTSGGASRGRWIPTTSVDEYGATIAKWFGVTGAEMGTIFPNLGRFATPDLGFLQAV